uniref:Uncharacterized protein n=1 Tax=Lotus japonicus TaxID=34305 RepID=I3S876_LOTJA|nr:unknown [Lotus japonicus]
MVGLVTNKCSFLLLGLCLGKEVLILSCVKKKLQFCIS